MNPLMFVNWRNLAEFFTAAMWVLATLMAILVIGLCFGSASPAGQPTHGQRPVIVGR